MTGALTKYDFHGCTLRVVMIEGEPWFVATDLAKTLGYRDAEKMTRLLDDDHKGTHIVGTPSGDQELTVISEAGMYRAIMRSQRAEAKAFERWVVGDVLPSIRRTGSYGSSDPVAFLDDPVALRMLLAERNDQFIEMKPKADAYDLIASTDGTVCVTDAAKMLKMRRKDLTKWLLENKWAYRRNGNAELVGYRNREQQGLVEHVYHETTNNLGVNTMRQAMRITAKGMQRLADAFKVEEAA